MRERLISIISSLPDSDLVKMLSTVGINVSGEGATDGLGSVGSDKASDITPWSAQKIPMMGQDVRKPILGPKDFILNKQETVPGGKPKYMDDTDGQSGGIQEWSAYGTG